MTTLSTQEALKVLVEHAEGSEKHRNMGLCPDVVEGAHPRDPHCKVCQALDVVGGPIQAEQLFVAPRVLAIPGQTFYLDMKTMNFVR